MPEQDYYRTLGLDPNATHADIRRAFRLLALRYHPDQNPDDPQAGEKFQLIQNAYKVLENPKTRANYDRARLAAQSQRKRTTAPDRRSAGAPGHTAKATGTHSRPSAPPADDDEEETRTRKPWWEADEEAPPRRSPQSPPAPPPPESIAIDGSDIEVDMTVFREVADLGSRQLLAVARHDPCAACGGTGAKPDTVVRGCPECDPNRPSPSCRLCGGRGYLFEIACSSCFGRGTTRVNKTYVVTIPPRSKTRQRIRIPGQGNPSRGGGQPGDLVIRLAVKPGPGYDQRDAAVYSEIHITPQTAAAGGVVRVKTVDGMAELVIPLATKSGAVFRLEGRGPILQDRQRGDHFVTVRIVET